MDARTRFRASTQACTNKTAPALADIAGGLGLGSLGGAIVAVLPPAWAVVSAVARAPSVQAVAPAFAVPEGAFFPRRRFAAASPAAASAAVPFAGFVAAA